MRKTLRVTSTIINDSAISITVPVDSKTKQSNIAVPRNNPYVPVSMRGEKGLWFSEFPFFTVTDQNGKPVLTPCVPASSFKGMIRHTMVEDMLRRVRENGLANTISPELIVYLTVGGILPKKKSETKTSKVKTKTFNDAVKECADMAITAMFGASRNGFVTSAFAAGGHFGHLIPENPARLETVNIVRKSPFENNGFIDDVDPTDLHVYQWEQHLAELEAKDNKAEQNALEKEKENCEDKDEKEIINKKIAALDREVPSLKQVQELYALPAGRVFNHSMQLSCDDFLLGMLLTQLCNIQIKAPSIGGNAARGLGGHLRFQNIKVEVLDESGPRYMWNTIGEFSSNTSSDGDALVRSPEREFIEFTTRGNVEHDVNYYLDCYSQKMDDILQAIADENNNRVYS